MAKLASSSFALDLLRRLLCARTTANAGTSGGGAVARRDDSEARRPAEPEGTSPCIVARLMGLDTMPAEARDPQPLRRIRSASSAEVCPTPSCFGDAPQPRAIRTSASFREKPTYLRQENDEFLLLSFSPEEHHRDDKGELFLLATRSDDDDDDAETARCGKRRDSAKKQRRGRRKLHYCGDEEAESAPDRSRRAAAPAECAGECGLQNSSPVSVLEARDGQEESSTTTTSSSLEEVEQAEPGSPSSEEIRPQLKQQGCSRRKLQPDFHDLDNLSPPATSSCHVSRCSDRERRNRRAVNKAEVITPDVSDIWQLICRLVEEDLNNMRWLTRDDANIAVEMASEILDQLICEATDELMQLRSDGKCTCFPCQLHLEEAPMLQKCSG